MTLQEIRQGKFKGPAFRKWHIIIAFLGELPILGIPACGMYHKVTVFDLVLPRVLAGERPGRRELAELGHGGLCRKCDSCVYPHCPFGKQ